MRLLAARPDCQRVSGRPEGSASDWQLPPQGSSWRLPENGPACHRLAGAPVAAGARTVLDASPAR